MVDLARDVVKEFIVHCPDPEITLNATYDDFKRILVGCDQVYRDKSQTSYSSSAPVLNSPHMILMNFLEEQSRKSIEKGATVFAYIPISIRRKPNACKSSSHETEEIQSLRKDL